MSLLGKWFGFSKEEVFDEGVNAYDLGDYESAIEAFEKSMDENPDAATLRLTKFYLGQSYAQLGAQLHGEGFHHEALRMYRSAIKFCPNSPDLLLRTARVCETLRDQATRDELVEAALQINPRFSDGLIYQGLCLYESGMRDAGLERLRQAMGIDTELDEAVCQKVLEYHGQQRPEEAAEAFRSLCESVSTDATLHKRIGDTFLRDGMLEDAAESYRKALRIHPRYREVHIALSRVLLRRGQHEQALEAIDHYLKLNAFDADAHAQRGEVLRAMKRESDASSEFQKAIEIDPNHPLALRRQAKAI